MNKLQMAHEYAILHLAKPENVGVEDSEIVAWAWDYVELMQAEAEKREDKSRPEALFAQESEDGY